MINAGRSTKRVRLKTVRLHIPCMSCQFSRFVLLSRLHFSVLSNICRIPLDFCRCIADALVSSAPFVKELEVHVIDKVPSSYNRGATDCEVFQPYLSSSHSREGDVPLYSLGDCTL